MKIPMQMQIVNFHLGSDPDQGKCKMWILTLGLILARTKAEESSIHWFALLSDPRFWPGAGYLLFGIVYLVWDKCKVWYNFCRLRWVWSQLVLPTSHETSLIICWTCSCGSVEHTEACTWANRVDEIHLVEERMRVILPERKLPL